MDFLHAPIESICVHDSTIFSLTLSHGYKDGKIDRPGGSALGSSNTAVIVGTPQGTLSHWAQDTVVRCHEGPISAVSIDVHSQWIASVGDDGVVCVVDNERIDTVRPGAKGPVAMTAVQWLGGNAAVVSADALGRVALWDVRTKDLQRRPSRVLARGNGVAAWALAQAQGRPHAVLVGADNGCVHVHDLRATEQGALLRLAAHDGAVRGVVCSASGAHVASVGDDGACLLWRTDGLLAAAAAHDAPAVEQLHAHETPLLCVDVDDNDTLVCGAQSGAYFETKNAFAAV